MRVTIYWQFRQFGVQLIFGLGLVADHAYWRLEGDAC